MKLAFKETGVLNFEVGIGENGALKAVVVNVLIIHVRNIDIALEIKICRTLVTKIAVKSNPKICLLAKQVLLKFLAS